MTRLRAAIRRWLGIEADSARTDEAWRMAALAKMQSEAAYLGVRDHLIDHARVAITGTLTQRRHADKN